MPDATMKLRVGVIGRGVWGKRIIETLCTKTQHCRHLWNCDSRDKLEAFLGPEYTKPSNIDFVVIATPFETHVKLMRECLLRGLPFIVEKPAGNYWELKKLFSDFPATRPFLCNHTLLFNPAIEAMVKHAQDFVHQGTVIELRGEHGGPGPVREDCNALLDYGSHGVAFALWLSGAKNICAIRLYCGEKCQTNGMELTTRDENGFSACPQCGIRTNGSFCPECGHSMWGAQNFTFEARFEHLKIHLRIGNNYPKKRMLYTVQYDIGLGSSLTLRFREFPERELLGYIGSDLIEMPFAEIDPLTNALETFAKVVKGEAEPDARFGWHLPLETMHVLETCEGLLPTKAVPQLHRALRPRSPPRCLP